MLISPPLVALVASVTWLVLLVVRRYVSRSPLDNIPGPLSGGIVQGNFPKLLDRHGWAFLDELTEKYGSVVKTRSFFGARGLWIFDPKALHYVVVKEQEIYERTFFRVRRAFMGPGLLGTFGEHHRRQRKLLNPVFSIANMRGLTPIFYEVIHRLRIGITKQIDDGKGAEVDILNWMGRAALELVGQGGLGYSFDPLTEDAPNDYGDALKALVPSVSALGFLQIFLLLSDYIPPRLGRIIVKLAPSRPVQKLADIIDTMDRQSRVIYNEKRRALLAGDEALKHQTGEGKDIMSVLLRANMEAAEEDRLPEEEVIAQMSTLTFAGTDTTSNALARTLHLLAKRQDIQDKLRAEITDARNGQDISYDHLVELPYLDAVCRETMRLYPPVAFVTRGTTHDTVLPLATPIRGLDGTEITSIPVPKGTMCNIGIYSCNRNKAIWGEDALEWRPERWLIGLPESATNAGVPGIYANLMTFLGGSRACIGFKFSQLEMKMVLSVLLESFKFYPSTHEIMWNRGDVAYPTVGRVSEVASMPLRVELVKS